MIATSAMLVNHLIDDSIITRGEGWVSKNYEATEFLVGLLLNLAHLIFEC